MTRPVIINHIERDYPGSPIRIVSWVDTAEQMISINVFCGADRSDLSRTFPLSEREAAATYYAYVQNGARAGRTEAALIADLQRTPVTTLEDTVPDTTGVMRDVRFTRTQVWRQPLTAPQRAAVEASKKTFGIITVNDVASWLTLRAIVDKGHATVLSRETTGKILSIQVKA